MSVTRAHFARRLVDSLRCAIVAIDDREQITALNRQAQAVLGCPDGEPEDALGHACDSLLASQPAVIELLRRGCSAEDAPSRAELRLAVRSGGRARTIGFTLCPVPQDDGAPGGAALLFRDLAPIEERAEQEHLRDRLAALGEMAAGLAHEIRNPLAGMEVLAGLLRRRLVDRPEEQALLEELIGELHAAAAVVSQGLEYVRPLSPIRDAIDPVKVVEDSLARARARVAFEGEVERRYDEVLPCVEADRDQLVAAVTDLVVNALEAMSDPAAPAAGRLRLAVSLEGGGLVISVGDDGPGVPESLGRRIFHPFFSTKQAGTGVGLATAQKVALSHGGRLELDPAPGGALFHLRLPLAGATS